MCTWCVYIFRFLFRADFFLNCYIATSVSTLECEKVISLLYLFYSQYLYLIKFIYLNLSVIFIHLNETSIIEHFLNYSCLV